VFEKSRRGASSLIVIILLFLIGLASLGYISRANQSMSLTQIYSETAETEDALSAAYQKITEKLKRATESVELNGSLLRINPKLRSEKFYNISEAYKKNEYQFLKDIVEAQAISPNGSTEQTHEFANFKEAFPTKWSPTQIDKQNYEIKYRFLAKPLQYDSSSSSLKFDYHYKVQLRKTQKSSALQTKSHKSGFISISLRGAAFSSWLLFQSETRSPRGNNFYYVGGDKNTSRDVFYGPVHSNARPNFYGSPVFYDRFSSGVKSKIWNMVKSASDNQQPDFKSEVLDGRDYFIQMPQQLRYLANQAIGNENMEIAHHSHGTLEKQNHIPAGVYIPVHDSDSKRMSAGVYVSGDAEIQMNVAQKASELASKQRKEIHPEHQNCKFQVIEIKSIAKRETSKTILTSPEDCETTYVISTQGEEPTKILKGKFNGHLFVEGSIQKLGGLKRNSPSIAKDFALTIAAAKSIYINNDLQYEDAVYVEANKDNTPSTSLAATVYGEMNNSGLKNTDPQVIPQISTSSKTVLGLVSLYRNVMVHKDAPQNLNIHAAIYAGNSQRYNPTVDRGCGTNYAGCGFGAVFSKENKGKLKLLGSIAEHRPQRIGQPQHNRGYQRSYTYDSRFKQRIAPPGYVISNKLQAYGSINPTKEWRLSQGDQSEAL
jgi:hypothetical protein